MKVLIKLIVVLPLFFGTLNAQDINECKTDIYFGNGVWNSAKDTEKSIVQLQKIMDKEIIKNDPKLKAKYGQVKLQYNWGQGNMLDVLETYYQLREAGQVSDYQFYAVIALLTKGNPSLTLGVIVSQELMEPFTRDWEQGNVDEMWQKYYDESFKLSHKVLLISHSQGNLFANRVYDTVSPTEYKNYFANMQIASPANEVKASKGDYVTLSTDLTSFDPIINFLPGSMSPNASGESGHEFVNAYLLQADPLNKITTKIKQLLVNLDTEPSQWETDQELNKGTEDFKITLKHRFDTTITSMQDIEVYPFKPSEKLYNVVDNTGGNGWVKASCGGEEVFDYWDEQEKREAYLINNLEKEKIIEEVFSFLIHYRLIVGHFGGGVDPYSYPEYDFIMPSACDFSRLHGGGVNRYIFLQSDEYYLKTYLNAMRNDGEYEQFSMFNNEHDDRQLSRELKCLIQNNGYELEDFTQVKREDGSEKRYITDNHPSLKLNPNEKVFVLEQTYIMVK